MKAKVFYLTSRVIYLWIALDHVPTATMKKELEDRLENFALSNLAKNNRGLVYSLREPDRVGIIVVSEDDVLPYREIEI